MKQTASLFLLVFLSIGLLNFCKKKDNPDPGTSPCANTDLSISASVSGNTLTVSASGGTAPYTYSKDGNTYVGSGTFSGMASGEHIVYVKDEKGCTKSTIVSVAGTGGNGGNGGGGGNSSKLVDERDGKEYTIVTIGDQVWMAENLNFETEEDSYCYNDESVKCDEFGRLYTWEVATEVCPAGWHLPSGPEWNELVEEIGGLTGNAAKLKEGGETGFGVKIGSSIYRGSDGEFVNSSSAHFWTSNSNVEDEDEAIQYRFGTSDNIIVGYTYKINGLSIRCIKD